MERLLHTDTLKEVFRGDESLGGLQEYADRVRQLHHRFLTAQLVPDAATPQPDIDELCRFAEDAEFLASQYTNPLVVEPTEGLPIEDVPSRQAVQDALALAGTLFEFLGDTVGLYEQHTADDVRRRLFTTHDTSVENAPESPLLRLGRSTLFYLKAALCYGLGHYESRTQVIFKRVLVNLTFPGQLLGLSNRQQWADYVLGALLGRDLRAVLRAKPFIDEQTTAIRAYLRRSMASEDSPRRREVFSSHAIADIETSLSLIDASLHGADAFLQGDAALIERSQNSLAHAVKSAYRLGNYELIWIIRTVGKVFARMWADSPWVRLEGLITRRTYLRKLIEDGVVTFWSSQIAALEMRSRLGPLNGGYLDERMKRVIVHVPTSAGKTLLAELAIAHQVFSDAHHKCVYVAPSRALCDQVTTDLANRLTRFGMRITTVVSDSDLNEYESMLFGRTHVIVVTPEKLSYMFRQKNQLIQDASLFVFDELHNLGKSERGWTYEEIISLLLQHPQTCDAKMLFLSAVMPNHMTVQEWVDPETLGDTIGELWQPTRLLKGAITFRLPGPTRYQQKVVLSGDLLYVRHKADLNSPLRINSLIQSRQVLKEKTTQDRRQMIRDPKSSDDAIDHAVAAAGRFARLGPVLVYCPRKDDASRFCSLASQLNCPFPPWRDGGEQQYHEIVEFVRDRFPEGHPLVDAMKHRIAFHHAGLPRDVRTEVEYAFRQGWVHILAATTTLVEGVNLPVKTLILSDYCQPRRWDSKKKTWNKPYPLSKSDFRNIAGRAGRALYETEGQVIFIQSIAGYPYGAFDTDFTEYLALEAESPELNITSTLADSGVLADLSRLVEEVDSGRLSEEQLLFPMDTATPNTTIVNMVKKLHVFTLLLQEQELVGEDEESFVRIFQRTFLGKQWPNQAPQIMGAFSHRGARAIKALIHHEDRVLFAQTGLKLSTCRTLMERGRAYWNGPASENLLEGPLDYSRLYEISDIIYGLGDDAVEPQKLILAREGKGSKTRQSLADDRVFFAEWILHHNTQDLLNKHFGFIGEPTWRAEQYVDYTQQTLGYRVPWTLSAFWLFSKAVVQQHHGVDLSLTPLGRELLLLPAYAKFGVNTPAAALCSTLGVSPASLARTLGTLYERQHPEAKYDYPAILHWLLTIEPLDLARVDGIQPSYIRRFTRILASLRPLDESIQESERTWEVSFPIAGWQYYAGEHALQTLRVGHKLLLRPEPENFYDPHAVAILTESQEKLGYVPRYLAPDIADRLGIRQLQTTVSEILRPAALSTVRVQCVDQW